MSRMPPWSGGIVDLKLHIAWAGMDDQARTSRPVWLHGRLMCGCSWCGSGQRANGSGRRRMRRGRGNPTILEVFSKYTLVPISIQVSFVIMLSKAERLGQVLAGFPDGGAKAFLRVLQGRVVNAGRVLGLQHTAAFLGKCIDLIQVVAESPLNACHSRGIGFEATIAEELVGLPRSPAIPCQFLNLCPCTLPHVVRKQVGWTQVVVPHFLPSRLFLRPLALHFSAPAYGNLPRKVLVVGLAI